MEAVEIRLCEECTNAFDALLQLAAAVGDEPNESGMMAMPTLTLQHLCKGCLELIYEAIEEKLG